MKRHILDLIFTTTENSRMEFISLVMSTIDQILEQVFDIANNAVLKEWGKNTVEGIADKALQDMPKI